MIREQQATRVSCACVGKYFIELMARKPATSVAGGSADLIVVFSRFFFNKNHKLTASRLLPSVRRGNAAPVKKICL